MTNTGTPMATPKIPVANGNAPLRISAWPAIASDENIATSRTMAMK
jgi:hypothetical protein